MTVKQDSLFELNLYILDLNIINCDSLCEVIKDCWNINIREAICCVGDQECSLPHLTISTHHTLHTSHHLHIKLSCLGQYQFTNEAISCSISFS